MSGKKLLHNLALVPAGLWDSEKILHRHHVQCGARRRRLCFRTDDVPRRAHRIPTVVFEPNVDPGLTNRARAGLATRAAVAYQETAQRFGRKSVVTGIPIRPEFFQIPHQVPRKLLPHSYYRRQPWALIPSIRRLSTRWIVSLSRKNQLFIVHQTGERDYNAVRVAYERHEFKAEVLPFIANMAERFAQADLIVCRSGAITVAEVAAAGRAAIFIPFGAATDAHQTRNAAAMQDAGAARLLPQDRAHSRTPDQRNFFSAGPAPENLRPWQSTRRALAGRAPSKILSILLEAGGARDERHFPQFSSAFIWWASAAAA